MIKFKYMHVEDYINTVGKQHKDERQNFEFRSISTLRGFIEGAIKSGMLRPREVARHCPNCGKLCWDSELNYSSSIKTVWGGSTLYGVCKECAETHSKQDDSNYRQLNNV